MILNDAKIVRENGVTTVAFADGDPPTKYVIFQSTDNPDTQDVALGQSGLYFETNDQSQGGYDLISEIKANANTLVISGHGALCFDGDGTVSFSLGDQARPAISALATLAERTGVPMEVHR